MIVRRTSLEESPDEDVTVLTSPSRRSFKPKLHWPVAKPTASHPGNAIPGIRLKSPDEPPGSLFSRGDSLSSSDSPPPLPRTPPPFDVLKKPEKFFTSTVEVDLSVNNTGPSMRGDSMRVSRGLDFSSEDDYDPVVCSRVPSARASGSGISFDSAQVCFSVVTTHCLILKQFLSCACF